MRREAWDKLEALQLRAKKPADDWDAAEKDKQDKITAIRTLLYTAAQIPADMTLEAVAETLELLERVEIDPALFGDLTGAVHVDRAQLPMLDGQHQETDEEQVTEGDECARWCYGAQPVQGRRIVTRVDAAVPSLPTNRSKYIPEGTSASKRVVPGE